MEEVEPCHVRFLPQLGQARSFLPRSIHIHCTFLRTSSPTFGFVCCAQTCAASVWGPLGWTDTLSYSSWHHFPTASLTVAEQKVWLSGGVCPPAMSFQVVLVLGPLYFCINCEVSSWVSEKKYLLRYFMGIVFVSNPQIKPGALTLYHCPGEKTPQLTKEETINWERIFLTHISGKSLHPL